MMRSNAMSFALLSTLGCAHALPEPPALPPDVRPLPAPRTDTRVLTQHNDPARTGANLEETILTPELVDASRSPQKFRYLFSRPVEGHLYAQPLYLPHVLIAEDGREHNVVFVATMHNLVYAFDADDPKQTKPLWKTELGQWLPRDFMRMEQDIFRQYNIDDGIGITSTPVIDPAEGVIFVSAKVCLGDADCRADRGKIVYRIAKLDVHSGTKLLSVDLDEKLIFDFSMLRERIEFSPRRHLQRPGLLLANGRIYLGFASHQDTSPFHGWMIALNASTLGLMDVLCTSCQTRYTDEIGIWQAGSGPAVDEAGNIYVMTGNGHAENEGGDYSSSFLKLNADLEVTDTFSPSGMACLNAQDVDLGSAGPMIVPNTRLVIGGGKEGVIYVLDRQSLGGTQPGGREAYLGGAQIGDVPYFQRPCPPQQGEGPPLQVFQAAQLWSNQFPGGSPADWAVATMSYHHIHGSPVYWDGENTGPMIYVWPERDRVRAFALDPAQQRFKDVVKPGLEPTATVVGPMAHKYGMPGGSLSISANGRSAGILWAVLPLEDNALTRVVDGVLRALDATTLRVLWDSRVDGGVQFKLAKYASPTVVNGKVFVGTFSKRLDVYGLVESQPSTFGGSR